VAARDIRDITFYVPYAPGGSTDPISRKYAELLEKQLKVKVIVENKPGASAPVSSLPLPPNSGLPAYPIVEVGCIRLRLGEVK
jgi:tripartite-type tricarboxylate transporter receptor subunit TctC